MLAMDNILAIAGIAVFGSIIRLEEILGTEPRVAICGFITGCIWARHEPKILNIIGYGVLFMAVAHSLGTMIHRLKFLVSVSCIGLSMYKLMCE